MRTALASILVALCASCAVPPQPILIAGRATPQDGNPPDCRNFTTRTRDAGHEDKASGKACRQTDGSWRIVQENPLPAPAIALAGPAPDDGVPDVTVYYPFDPSQLGSSFLDWGEGYYGDGGYRTAGGSQFHSGRRRHRTSD
jgi:hypothetical protein